MSASQRDRILGRLQAMGANPKRSLGQNFLVSESTIARILQAALAPPPKPAAIVEVGPGLGSLTDGLLAFEGELILIELDRLFAEHWRKALAMREANGGGKGRVIEADALALDWGELAAPEGALLVSNLPYQISSSLVIERSVAPCGVSRMVLMFQKEVAQRLTAAEKSAEYGLLTAVARAFWDVRTVLEAGPRDFYPAPNVASRVVEFRAIAEPGVALADRPRFLALVKAAFAHRRKLMARNLAHAPSTAWAGGSSPGPERIADALTTLGLDASRTRAEELSPRAFVALFQALSR